MKKLLIGIGLFGLVGCAPQPHLIFTAPNGWKLDASGVSNFGGVTYSTDKDGKVTFTVQQAVNAETEASKQMGAIIQNVFDKLIPLIPAGGMIP